MKKIMKKIIVLFIIAIAFAGCPKTTTPPPQSQQASLRFDWIAAMTFAGDVYAMKETAAKNGLTLKCEQAGFGIEPVKLVTSGANDFGVVSLEQMYLANEKGADLVAIGIINDISPVVFLAKSDKKFSQPSDFENKSVGINPGGATEVVYRAFVRGNNLDKSKIREIPADYDIKSFISGSYDIRLAFAYVEPIDLKMAGVGFSQISPADFGMKLPGRVYFTKRETVEKNPELVQKFINSVAEGWELSFANKVKAIDNLAEFEPKIDKSRETESFSLGEKYFTGFNNRVLTFDMDNLMKAANGLVESGVIKQTDFTKVLNSSFIENYHKSKK
jgi:ABC-type nitrate/sulfonate/bicarbonate transport system substrate-binding protein